MIKILKRNKSVIESLISLFFQKFVDLILPLLIIPYMIDHVGVKYYGYYAFANSIFIYLLNLTQYGFALSAVRDISVNRDNHEQVNIIFNKVFTTKLGLVVLSILFLIVTVLAVPSLRQHWQLYFFMSIMLVGNLFMPSVYFYGIEKMRFITIMNLVLKSTFVVLVFLFVKDQQDYLSISFYQSIGYVMSGLIGHYVVTKYYHIKLKVVSIRDMISELRLGFSSFLNLMSPSIYTNTAVFVVGVYLTSVEVSVIQVTMIIVSAFGAINTIMTNALYPYINRNRAKFESAKKLFILSGIAFSIFMFVAAPIVLKYWVGAKFTEYQMDRIYLMTKIFSISPLLMSIVSTYGVNGLLVCRKDKLFSYITIVSTLLCFAFAFILTPIFSLIGAALAIILSRSIYAFASFYYYNKLKIQT